MAEKVLFAGWELAERVISFEKYWMGGSELASAIMMVVVAVDAKLGGMVGAIQDQEEEDKIGTGLQVIGFLTYLVHLPSWFMLSHFSIVVSTDGGAAPQSA